jgi:Ala-tRNA(Pro) deacylase
MPMQQLREFLDKEGVRYITIQHSRAYTAQEVAASAHIRGKEMAKTVMVKLDGKMAMVVLPASLRVSPTAIKAASGAANVELASEAEFKGLFPGCEPGAMPPFGHLYGMDVYVTESLTADEEIAFNAGSHTECIRLAYQDFERLERPNLVKA